MLASLFAVSYVNGHPSWLTWVVMLLGVFSIFEAAIKADEDALAANGLAKIIISHSGKLASQRDEYKFVAESLDDLYVRECKKTNELKKSIQGIRAVLQNSNRLHQVKARTILNLHQEIKELKASHHGEMIGHEVHLKQVKKNRDELRVRVDSLEQALNKVSDWDAHPEGYEANFGAWGVRDFYRSLAIKPLQRRNEINGNVTHLRNLRK